MLRFSDIRTFDLQISTRRSIEFADLLTSKLFDQTSRIPICDLYKYSNTTRRVTMVKVANRSYQVQLAIVIDIDRYIRVICSHVNRNARKRKERKRQRGTSNKQRVIKKQGRGRKVDRCNRKAATHPPRFIIRPTDSFHEDWAMSVEIRDTLLIKSRLCLALFMHGYILVLLASRLRYCSSA